MIVLANLIENAKTDFDLTETADRQSLMALTEQLLGLSLDDVKTAARQDNAPLEFKIGAKLVESRQFMQTISKPIRLGIVCAMWGEQNRLRP
ncbi:MAG: glycosyltransferase, partial [Chloroflexi bacterium]|nr:glycosyltransferase [Chloroflexota bacterium]